MVNDVTTAIYDHTQLQTEDMQAYFSLRSNIFRNENFHKENIKIEATATPQENNPNTYFILAKKEDGEVVGGIRVAIHNDKNDREIHCEHTLENFNIRSILKDNNVDADRLKIAEVSMQLLKKENRGEGLGLGPIKKIYMSVMDFTRKQDVKVLVAPVLERDSRLLQNFTNSLRIPSANVGNFKFKDKERYNHDGKKVYAIAFDSKYLGNLIGTNLPNFH